MIIRGHSFLLEKDDIQAYHFYPILNAIKFQKNISKAVFNFFN